MKFNTIAATILLTATSVCFAQTQVDIAGNWDVKWQENNLQLGAKLSIQDETGTWQMFSQSRRNPCFAMIAPINLKRTGENTATIALKYSTALNGCPDGMVHIHKIDANTMLGKRGGVNMVLTRN